MELQAVTVGYDGECPMVCHDRGPDIQVRSKTTVEGCKMVGLSAGKVKCFAFFFFQVYEKTGEVSVVVGESEPNMR